MGMGRRDYSAVTWDKYFDETKEVQVSPTDTFRVYMSGSEGPVCLFLHGGGFSALTWACLVVSAISCYILFIKRITQNHKA